MTVYIDLLFSANFIMDFIIISITEILGSVKFGLKRAIISAAVGAMLATLHFILARNAVASLLFGIFIPPVTIITVLFPCKKELFIRCLLFYCSSAFFLSGAIEFILNLFGKNASGLTSSIIYLISGLLFFIVKNTHTIMKSAALKGEHKLTINYKEYSVTRNATLDTGNSLTDPTTKNPVIVADEMLLCELFSPSCNSLNLCEWIDTTDLRVIPYKTIDNEGVMLGFLPEKITVDGRRIPGAVIAISDNASKCGLLLNSAIM